ncbi:hypothetical protein CH373_00205 [Leptospira perolatii]|uniref:Uncharacterized protein n=1 Tax=Leptospira perolatii TaxID=2023191 RepID=A0A2M9ZR20_9LEPT|nr:hypothetical protein [Leptospira perolatii]PJZ70996.1 hypothetical protein CH360_00205 [Leptospira perolatii]PJZ74528.1 hypothetical protein CH373_00205 [Leptospira perolatii]
MVQVDVFWSYGLGAGYAMAAARQIRKLQEDGKGSGSIQSVSKEKGDVPFWKNTYFITNLLYLALLFAPSGLYLVWQFTSWETMHVGDKGMPGWLVALFGMTNVSQGILGFWVVWKLLKAGKSYLAYLQVPLAYFGMFFILVHGWDGTGYQRFFSPTAEDFQNNWTWATAGKWFSSDVAITLDAMGVILIPTLIVSMLKFLQEGWSTSSSKEFPTVSNPSSATAVIAFLATVFVGTLGLVIVSSVVIHQTGWILGSIVSIGIIYLFGVSKFGIFPVLYKKIMQIPAESAAPAGKIRTSP